MRYEITIPEAVPMSMEIDNLDDVSGLTKESLDHIGIIIRSLPTKKNERSCDELNEIIGKGFDVFEVPESWE